jgi:hypothetical protein
MQKQIIAACMPKPDDLGRLYWPEGQGEADRL